MARVMTRVDTRKQQLTAHLRVTAKDQDMANKVVYYIFLLIASRITVGGGGC